MTGRKEQEESQQEDAYGSSGERGRLGWVLSMLSFLRNAFYINYTPRNLFISDLSELEDSVGLFRDEFNRLEIDSTLLKRLERNVDHAQDALSRNAFHEYLGYYAAALPLEYLVVVELDRRYQQASEADSDPPINWRRVTELEIQSNAQWALSVSRDSSMRTAELQEFLSRDSRTLSSEEWYYLATIVSSIYSWKMTESIMSWGFLRALKGYLLSYTLLTIFAVSGILASTLFIPGLTGSLFGPLTNPTAPSFLVYVVLFGLLGASVSGLLSTAGFFTDLMAEQTDVAALPREALSGWLVLAKASFGTAAAVAVVTLLYSGLLNIETQSGALVLAVAFAAGFSERLLKRALEPLLGEEDSKLTVHRDSVASDVSRASESRILQNPPESLDFAIGSDSNSSNIDASVLLVGDNPVQNTRIKALLETAGASVDIKLSTEEALTTIQNEEYDVIVSDMARGDDDRAGYSLLTSLRERDVLTPVIFLSSESPQVFKSEAKARGAFGHTNDLDELIALVAQASRE